MRLIRNVLDAQVVDRRQNELGKVDGILLDISDPARPRVTALLVGSLVFAKRVHPPFSTLIRWFSHKWHARTLSIPWATVRAVTLNVQVEMDAEDAESLTWERWLSKHVVARIPGSK